MSFLTFIIGPVVGGIIGGFTNKVAIRMLFRPFEEKHLWGHPVPLTPGIIPKQKPRIAEAIGSVVSKELLNPEVLGRTLLSDDMLHKLEQALDQAAAGLANDNRSLQEFLCDWVDKEKMQTVSSQIENELALLISQKLDNPAIGARVSTMVVDQVVAKLQESVVGRLGASILEHARQSVEKLVSDNVNEMLHNNARLWVRDWLHGEIQQLQDQPVRHLVAGRQKVVDALKTSLMKGYRSLVENNLDRILDSLNLQKVISDRINDLSMPETERLILSIMDNELKMLVLFGVFLGFLMGFITSFI